MTERTRIVDKDLMKRSNMGLIFNEIFMQSRITRPQIARNIGISSMSTGRLTDELLTLGLIEEEISSGAVSGRPPKVLRVARERLNCAGAFIDRDCIRAGFVDPYGHIAVYRQCKFPVSEVSPDETADMLCEMLEQISKELPEQNRKPYLGLAVPGLIGNMSGTVRFSSQLKWDDVELKQEIEARLPGWQVAVDNDLKAWALAEGRFGAAREYRNAAFFSVGSGIGASAIVDNVIYRGRDNRAGEIGHVVIDPNGRMCECGKIGCLQTKFADWAILQDVHAVKSDGTLDDVLNPGENQPPWAAGLLRNVMDYIAISLNLLANTYAPETIVLGGYLFTQYPALLPMVSRIYLQTAATMHYNPSVDLRMTKFGCDHTMVGGAALGFQQYLKSSIFQNLFYRGF